LKDLIGTAAVVKKNAALLSARMHQWVRRQEGGAFVVYTVTATRSTLAGCGSTGIFSPFFTKALDISSNRVLDHFARLFIVSPSVYETAQRGNRRDISPFSGRLENCGVLILLHAGTSSL
jgi:hypothetical protein